MAGVSAISRTVMLRARLMIMAGIRMTVLTNRRNPTRTYSRRSPSLTGRPASPVQHRVPRGQEGPDLLIGRQQRQGS